MKFIATSFLLFFICFSACAQYNDPNFPKPSSGYGADGTHAVGVKSFTNPNYPAKNIEIYYPADINTSVPTIFYSHAFGGNVSANISGMLNFVAQKGYAIVYVPYQTIGVSIADRYNNLLAGFRKAARDYPAIIDTTRVGFLGHSFGGGASFGLAYQCFTENSWGQNGRFIYALAQWYAYNITQVQLQSFPANTKVLTEVFDDDSTNDHRMAVDVFNNLNISAAEKDFLLVKSDTIGSYIYSAEHNLPNTSAAFDALDYYAYYRLLDALCDYNFNGNAAGKNVALGNGSAAQVTMPAGLKPLVQTDHPVAVYPEGKYLYPCTDTQNPRSSYCAATLGMTSLTGAKEPKLYPNPVTGTLKISLPDNQGSNDLRLLDATGKLLLTKTIDHRGLLDIDMVGYAPGLYFVLLGDMRLKVMKE